MGGAQDSRPPTPASARGECGVHRSKSLEQHSLSPAPRDSDRSLRSSRAFLQQVRERQTGRDGTGVLAKHTLEKKTPQAGGARRRERRQHRSGRHDPRPRGRRQGQRAAEVLQRVLGRGRGRRRPSPGYRSPAPAPAARGSSSPPADRHGELGGAPAPVRRQCRQGELRQDARACRVLVSSRARGRASRWRGRGRRGVATAAAAAAGSGAEGGAQP